MFFLRKSTCSIDLNKVKIIGPRNKKSRSADKISSYEEKINKVSSFILKQNSDITILYELVTHDDNSKATTRVRPEIGVQDVDEDHNFVKMTIKQSLGSIVRVVWSGCLFMSTTSENKDHHQRNEDERKGCEKNNNTMEFIQTIRSELLQSDGVIKQLLQNESKLESQMLSWKDTADKMGDTWQEEKDGLLNRFLVLLNRVKSELRTAQNELKEEKEKNLLLTQKERAPLIPHISQKTDLVDYEDEHDLECYDPEEVKRLAMGDTSQRSKRSAPNGKAQQVKKRQRQAVHKTESSESPTKQPIRRSILISQPGESLNVHCDHTMTESQIMRQSQSSVRKNPHTGAIEMWSAESIFSQDIHINAKSNNSNTLNSISKQVAHPAEEDKKSNKNALILDGVLNTTSEWLKDPVGEKMSSNKGALALNKTCTSEDKVASKDTYFTDDDASDCSEALL